MVRRVTSTHGSFELTEVAIEPLRRGFVVDDGNLDQLVLAMRAATSLWGGQRGIIVPRLASGELGPGALQMAEIAGLDQLVDFSAGAGNPDPQAAPVPITPARPFTDFRAWQPPPIVTFSLEEISTCSVTFAAPDAGPFMVAAFGAVADEEELTDWRSRQADVSEYHERQLTPVEILRAQTDALTGIGTTIRHAPVYFAVAPFAQSVALIWVVEDDGESFDDLLGFWNLRALRPSDDGITLVVRRSYFSDSDCVAHMREIISSRSRMTPSVAINGLSNDRRALALCARRLGFPRKRDSKWSENLFGDKPPGDFDSAVSVEMRQFWLGQRRTGVRATADTWRQEDGLHLRFANPLRFAPAFTGAHPIRVRWHAPGVQVPRRPAVAQLFLNAAAWNEDTLTWGAALQRDYQFIVQEPTPEQILAAATTSRFALSDKGRELSALRARLASLDLFRQALALDVITALTPDDSRRLRRALGDHPEVDEQNLIALINSMGERRMASSDLASTLAASGTRRPRPSVNVTLEALVRAEAIDRGMEVICDLCAVREFIPLTEYRAIPLCRGCHSPARYRKDTGEAQLVYRLNTLIQRISANGGLPMLAALAVLEDEGAYVLPGVEGPFGEVDIVGYSGAMVFAGECKTSSAGFSDIAGDLKKSKDVGADMHLVICRAPLDETTRAAIAAQATSQGLELRVLDATDLFLPDPGPRSST